MIGNQVTSESGEGHAPPRTHPTSLRKLAGGGSRFVTERGVTSHDR